MVSVLQVIFWFAERNCSPPYRNPVGRAIFLHFLRSFSVFLRAHYAQIAELALARSNSVNFMGSAR
jgi:hypothetical protein